MLNQESIKILSFDPSLSDAGWAVAEYHLGTGNSTILKTGNLSPNKLATRVNMSEQVEKYGKRLISLDILEEMVIKLVEENKPDYVVSEDAFINPGMPSAFISLIHWLNTIELLLYKRYKKPLIKLAPKTVKMIVTGSGASGKIPVLESILNDKHVSFKHKVNSKDLNEHTSDAIAVGIAFARTVLISMINATPSV